MQCELESELPTLFHVSLSDTITVPPISKIVVLGNIKKGFSAFGWYVAKSLVNVKTVELTLYFANMSSDSQKIYSGILAAKCEPTDAVKVDVLSQSQNCDLRENIGPSQKCEKIKSSIYLYMVVWLLRLMSGGPVLVTLKIALNHQKPYCLRPKQPPQYS